MCEALSINSQVVLDRQLGSFSALVDYHNNKQKETGLNVDSVREHLPMDPNYGNELADASADLQMQIQQEESPAPAVRFRILLVRLNSPSLHIDLQSIFISSLLASINQLVIILQYLWSVYVYSSILDSSVTTSLMRWMGMRSM